MLLILLLGFAFRLAATACERECAPVSSLLSDCSLPPLSTDSNQYRETTARNFIGLEETPFWSMGEQTFIIEDYQQARCLCIEARDHFRDCRTCISHDDYLNRDGKRSDKRDILGYYTSDCTDLGFYANDTLAYPTTTGTDLPSATVPVDASTSTASAGKDCDELCGVINGQILECGLTPLDSDEPENTRIPSSDLDYYGSLLLNRTAAECVCTMQVLRRMYGCWKCWVDGGAPSPFLILDYDYECNHMGYWSDEEFVVVEEEETSAPDGPDPTSVDPLDDGASGPLKMGGRLLVPVLLMLFYVD